MEIQSRTNDGELRYFQTLKEAMRDALVDSTVWKISFSLPNGERVRLVRHWLSEEHSMFEYSDLMDEVNEELRKTGAPAL